MKQRFWQSFIGVLISSAALFAQNPFASDGVNWPGYRGYRASGVAENAKTPVEWNVESGENIKWKTAIPGLGHSSPVIWGDKIFVTTAISGKDDPHLKVGLYGNIAPVDDKTVHKWLIFCVDKKSGEMLWRQTSFEGVPKVKRHTKATHANSTLATDGRLYFSAETGDIYVVKADKTFEVLATNSMGEICMSTPAISDDTLFFRTKNHLVAVGEK